MKNPLITIAIPTFNTPIKEFNILMRSVLEQSYTNLDILIVDDGSNEKFKSILEVYKKSDNRIRIITKQVNKGIYDSRNIIFKNTLGEYLACVDSDDYIPNNYIEELVKVLDTVSIKNSIVVSCPFIKFNHKIPKVTTNLKVITFDNTLLQKSLLGDFGHSICGKLISSNLLKDVSVKEENGFDDAQCIPQIYSKCLYAIITNKVSYFYRQRNNSILHSNNFPLLQAYRTYTFYLTFADKFCTNAVKQIQLMIIYQKLKLCCVNYSEKYTYKNAIAISKELKTFVKENKNSVKINDKKIKLAIKFPRIFRLLFVLKRKNIIR